MNKIETSFPKDIRAVDTDRQEQQHANKCTIVPKFGKIQNNSLFFTTDKTQVEVFQSLFFFLKSHVRRLDG